MSLTRPWLGPHAECPQACLQCPAVSTPMSGPVSPHGTPPFPLRAVGVALTLSETSGALVGCSLPWRPQQVLRGAISLQVESLADASGPVPWSLKGVTLSEGHRHALGAPRGCPLALPGVSTPGFLQAQPGRLSANMPASPARWQPGDGTSSRTVAHSDLGTLSCRPKAAYW